MNLFSIGPGYKKAKENISIEWEQKATNFLVKQTYKLRIEFIDIGYGLGGVISAPGFRKTKRECLNFYHSFNFLK